MHILGSVTLTSYYLETLFLLPKNGSYVIYYPYACLVAWNAHEGIFPTNFFPTDTLATRFTYLEFEDLVARYLRFKMNFFVSVSQENGISIKDLHRGAVMNPKIESLVSVLHRR
jgi:hypothetical protein